MAYGSGRPAEPKERLMRHVRIEGDCWIWAASSVVRTNGRYGSFNWGGGKYMPAHRASYIVHTGDIPAGHHVDHLCRNTLCINPAHLEAVTPAENSMRGVSPNVAAHLLGKCRNGHDRSESVLRKGTNRVVYCKACRREKRRARKAA